MTRPVNARYQDPLDAVWMGAAARLGLRIERSSMAYATTDGRGTLHVAPPAELDQDDCLAQIVFHEICHALVEGPDSFHLPDWGLANDLDGTGSQQDTVREHACLRVQATLGRRYGLRKLLAPTTEFRSYYDALPVNPMDGPPDDPSIHLARKALGRAVRAPFAGVLHEALARTAYIHRVASAAAPAPSGTELPTLWQVAPPPPLHPTGHPLSEESGVTCRSCAWSFPDGAASRCRRTRTGKRAARIDLDWPACVLYEPALDCHQCAACCRDAYDLVPVGRRERAARLPVVESAGTQLRLRRMPQGWCAALAGPPYTCTIYPDRPRACRDFPVGGEACLEARRRVGLTV
ncbi:MAG: YkgJ family cysteine cluster protein [Myxococcales bacterium]|nr:YkgJ family cysteine cluster protein [Myxococcota bacterium]MDW8281502.1 YkgJ family cysteine cluster protein [Myxococcales bacterium]